MIHLATGRAPASRSTSARGTWSAAIELALNQSFQQREIHSAVSASGQVFQWF